MALVYCNLSPSRIFFPFPIQDSVAFRFLVQRSTVIMRPSQRKARSYPQYLLRHTTLRTTAAMTNLPLPKGYHFHNLTPAERKSPALIRRLSGVCEDMINAQWARKHLKSALKYGNAIVVTKGDSKRIIAFIIFKYRGIYRHHYIDLVCTRKTHQGKGLGTLLIQHVLLLFLRTAPRTKHTPGIFLQTWKAKNPYYEKLGFTRTNYKLGHAASSSAVSQSYHGSAPTSDGLHYMRLTRGLPVYKAMAREMNQRLPKKKH